MKRVRQILHATDFSATSRRAFDTALTLAKSQNAKLTVVHVFAPIVLVPEQYLDAVTMDRLQTGSPVEHQQLGSLATRAAEVPSWKCRRAGGGYGAMSCCDGPREVDFGLTGSGESGELST